MMILVEYDDPDFAENCSRLLEAFGYVVAIVSSITDALEKISLLNIDLLISNCSMPAVTGLDLSKKIRVDKHICPVPALLMRGSLKRDVAHLHSYDAFRRKPLLSEHLITQVKKYFLSA